MNGLRPWQQEKNYIQATILGLLSESQVCFKGGTYLWFFHGLQRFSEDLDFTATGEVSLKSARYVSEALRLYGIENDLKLMGENHVNLSFRIMADGPLHTNQQDRCVVYVEISRRERIMQKMIPLKLDMPGFQLPVKRLLGMSLEEVGAEKVRAVLTREKSRDIYDLHYLVAYKKIQFNLQLVNQKLNYYGKSFDSGEFVSELHKRKDRFKKDLLNLVFDDLPDINGVVQSLANWCIV